MKTGRRPTVVAGIVLAVFAAACSSDDGGGGAATDAPAPASDEVSADSVNATSTTAAVVATDADPTTTAVADTAPATDAATTTLGTVPDDGVAGIDSADAFCRSWSEFAGSFQALASAWSFGTPEAASRSEIAASQAIVAAVSGLDTNLPAELESEREVFVIDLAGPMFRRAERARSVLVDEGLADDAIDALGAAWLEALSAAGLGDPNIDVVLPAGVDPAAFEAAATALREALPPINQDPSLITDAQFPLTDQYLSVNCPDHGTLGGNDIIDEI